MTKPIENRKVEYPNGHVSYYMNRMMADGCVYRYVLHLAPHQIGLGRKYIADTLRSARADLVESVAELNGANHAKRRRWSRGL